MKEKRRIIKDKTHNYLRIDPLPSEDELNYFYQKKYYQLIKKGGRAPEIRRLSQGGKIAREELKWITESLYREIDYTLKSLLPSSHNRVLEVGCGRGDFMRFMIKSGWNVVGIEPSQTALPQRSTLKVYNLPLDEFLVGHQKEYKNSFDAVVLINVLEHVIDPKAILDGIKVLLKPASGIVCIRVPNDFNVLQGYAEKMTKKKRWWIAMPDHVNYFTIDSLHNFLEMNGFKAIDKTVDFPMELFLLMGDDYTNNPKLGSVCHKKRVRFELSLPYALRRKLYRTLAQLGIGRDCLIYAQVK